MEKITAEYQITIGDFRKASYYGMFVRYRKPLRIMLVVLAVAVIYGIAGHAGMGEVNPLVFFLGVAYLVWGLLMFAMTERQILQYVKTPESFLGCRYVTTIDTHKITFEVPERKLQFSTQLNKLAFVFELNDLFLIYVSAQETYLLPCRALTDRQRQALRTAFRQRLGDKFGTRFEGKSGK